ncbi:unnamed protein product [Ectocarpus fasciculatus]
MFFSVRVWVGPHHLVPYGIWRKSLFRSCRIDAVCVHTTSSSTYVSLSHREVCEQNPTRNVAKTAQIIIIFFERRSASTYGVRFFLSERMIMAWHAQGGIISPTCLARGKRNKVRPHLGKCGSGYM